MSKILEMRDIVKEYRGVRALNNVNFDLEVGDDPRFGRREWCRQIDFDKDHGGGNGGHRRENAAQRRGGAI